MEYARIYDANYNSNNMNRRPSFQVQDPDGNVVTVRAVNELLVDVDNLRADGGHDCPEFGMTGILKTIELLDGIRDVTEQTKHNIIVLTDASARDDNLYQTVINKANSQSGTQRDISVHFFYSGGGCVDGFGHYEDIKSATNGFSVNQINAANFRQFVDFVLASRSTKKRSSHDRCQNFDISYFVSEFSSLFETSEREITITKPDRSTETVITFSNSFAVYKVTNPQPGQWQACVSSGTLQHSLSITVDLDLEIDFLKRFKSGDLLPTNALPFACKLFMSKFVHTLIPASFFTDR